eukprot:TRINITY_DN21075_c0_g1_i1.p1 TRINITY_DN21075_c0_g1~~TRINITY_DN21075_c0_g1_i1.p1  ORF type:complete len:155 (-),score=25.44 TRINITY_DN21075_c0_g1_i1:10-474(-)
MCIRDRCKYCLAYDMLGLLLNSKAHNYLCFCVRCQLNNRLEIIKLDCGCTWIYVGRREKNVKKCSNDHELSSLDYCLVNDFTSFGDTCKMLFNCLEDMSKRISLNDKVIQKLGIGGVKELTEIDIEGTNIKLSLIHICRCRRYAVCRSRWSPYT